MEGKAGDRCIANEVVFFFLLPNLLDSSVLTLAVFQQLVGFINKASVGICVRMSASHLKYKDPSLDGSSFLSPRQTKFIASCQPHSGTCLSL